MGTRDYFESITYAANTIFEGMAVTFSHLFREPITVQYPDRMDRPITETLPDRYRGFLEVQLDICTGCRRCQRACPIECIVVELEKNPETKKQEMVRFDIDIGKCMYCGLCVEACKVESTGALRHTVNFEGTTEDFGTLTFRFIKEGTVPLYRAPKDKSEIPLGTYGPIACEARERALRDNPADLEAQQAIWEAQEERKRQAAAEAAAAAAKEAAAKQAAAAADAAAKEAAEAEGDKAAAGEPAADGDEGAAKDG